MKVIITDEEIDLLNAHYGTHANANDADHYKLCQVILYLEGRLKEMGEVVRQTISEK